MPHPVDPATHATHDLELVAAYAAGDATGPDLETATALVAGCAGCSALHHDLRLIAAALPAMPAPVRPRDFRLTPEQAASLRPAGWRRLVRGFAGPRFSFAAPLGTGLATLGLAGLLIGTLAGTPLGAATGTAQDQTRNLSFESAAPLAPAPSPAAGAEMQVPDATNDAKGPIAAPTANPVYNSQGAAGAGAEGFSPDAQPKTGSPGTAVEPGSKTSPANGQQALATPAPDRRLALAGVIVLLGGLLLVGLRLASRRLA